MNKFIKDNYYLNNNPNQPHFYYWGLNSFPRQNHSNVSVLKFTNSNSTISTHSNTAILSSAK